MNEDVEGAECLVLQGGSEYISQFRMISLEMKEANSSKVSRKNEAQQDDVDRLLKNHGFQFEECLRDGSFDCHHAKSEVDLYTY